jgi:hypothetical protein
LDFGEKIFLLLQRGADIRITNHYGDTCLHIILGSRHARWISDRCYREELKDILMCMVTAGADVFASNRKGETISQAACWNGHVDLWREVLGECGYDPGEVFCPENCFDGEWEFPGMGVFSAMTSNARSTKLSFSEYGQQRNPIIRHFRKFLSCSYLDTRYSRTYRADYCTFMKIWTASTIIG